MQREKEANSFKEWADQEDKVLEIIIFNFFTSNKIVLLSIVTCPCNLILNNYTFFRQYKVDLQIV